jgi:putative flippase GtrA
MKISLIYALLAAIATMANIASQFLTLQIYFGPYSLRLSVAVGTAVGLLVKYILDKRYIFLFVAQDRMHDARTFVLYACMGVLTTLLFWGIEFAFQRAFGVDAMRYLGAAIGLAIGYLVKYQLDRRFTFGRAVAR